MVTAIGIVIIFHLTARLYFTDQWLLKSLMTNFAFGNISLSHSLFRPFFQEVKDKMVLLITDDKKKDSNNFGTWLKHILQQPFTRLKEYGKIVNKIALKYPAVSTYIYTTYFITYILLMADP